MEIKGIINQKYSNQHVLSVGTTGNMVTATFTISVSDCEESGKVSLIAIYKIGQSPNDVIGWTLAVNDDPSKGVSSDPTQNRTGTYKTSTCVDAGAYSILMKSEKGIAWRPMINVTLTISGKEVGTFFKSEGSAISVVETQVKKITCKLSIIF